MTMSKYSAYVPFVQISDETRAFLTSLWDGGLGFIWTMDASKRPIVVYSGYAHAIPDRINASPQDHVFFGVHPVDRPVTLKSEVNGDSVESVRTLFVDFDSGEVSLDNLLAINPSPSAVVETSPGKWHAYWFFEAPLDTQDQAGRDIVDGLQKLWVESLVTLAPDRAVKDRGRSLRLPGSVNPKESAKGHVATLVHFDASARYAIADLETAARGRLPKSTPDRKPQPASKQATGVMARRYWASVQTAIERIAAAPTGSRNATLSANAYWLGGLDHLGFGSESEIVPRLVAAVAGDDADDMHATARAQYRAGTASPVTLGDDIAPLDALAQDYLRCGVDPARLRYNRVLDRIEYDGEPWEDRHTLDLRLGLRAIGYGERGCGAMRQMGVVEEGLSRFAHSSAYHPIADYLRRARENWDGRDAIHALCSHFTCEQSVTYADGNSLSLFAVLLTRWLIGAVERAMKPGSQNMMLVIDGPQGIGKSYLAEWLGRDVVGYTHSGQISPDNKDCRLRLTSSFVWEVAELGATTRRADIEALKSFITLTQVRDRAPYARRDTTRPSLANFIGTLNDGAFLSDDTGNRRFRTCTITAIDRGYSATIAPSAVWGQAVALWEQGYTSELDEREAHLLAELNATRYTKDTGLDSYVAQYVRASEEDTWVTAAEIAEHVNERCGRTVITPGHITSGQLARALVNNGHTKPTSVLRRGARRGKLWQVSLEQGWDDQESEQTTTTQAPSEQTTTAHAPSEQTTTAHAPSEQTTTAHAPSEHPQAPAPSDDLRTLLPTQYHRHGRSGKFDISATIKEIKRVYRAAGYDPNTATPIAIARWLRHDTA